MILDLSRKNPFYSILPESTLLSATEEFACGTHRGMIATKSMFVLLFIDCSDAIVCVLEPSGQVKVNVVGNGWIALSEKGISVGVGHNS